MKGLSLLLFLLISLACSPRALSDDKPLVGHFYVHVDDIASLSLGGKELHKAKIGLSKTGEITIKENDVINIKSINTGGPRRFVMFFLTTDRKNIIHFTDKDYRLVPNYDEDGVTVEEFDELTETAVKLKRPDYTYHVGIKDKSDSVWGQGKRCRVAVKIRPLMWESYWD